MHAASLRMVLATSLIATAPSLLPAQMQSVDQALTAASTTGKPIFAMAGSKT